jgi:hypothetical protein
MILFLAANPLSLGVLDLGRECAAIQREIAQSPGRDALRFEARWAIGIDDLIRQLTQLQPAVIHISGHGGGAAGLMLEDDRGRPQPLSGRALAMIVRAAARMVRLIVLDACYSTVQAEALRRDAACVVGMTGAIGDDAARVFSAQLYGALGCGRSVGNAVEHGVAALAAHQLPDEAMPRLVSRDGVDPDRVTLVDPPSPAGGT